MQKEETMKEINSAKATLGLDDYDVSIQVSNHTLRSDEPESHGGKNRGPAPYELVLAGLASCTLITLRMYAERKGWELGELELELRLLKARDAKDRIERKLRASAELSDEQWDKLLEIARKTPVTRTLLAGADIDDSAERSG